MKLPRTALRASVALMAVALSLSLVSIVSGTHVQPELHQGNPTCGDLGDYDHEFRIEPVTEGTHQDPDSDFEVTITLHETADGPVFDFEANLPVDAVFVKGGPGGNLYEYNPPVTSDDGLHAPGNDQGTAVEDPPWSGLSHLSFCFNVVPEPTPTPTPTPVPTATPTPTPDPTATPTPTPVPTATPTPTPDPTATPTPTPDPTATPTPTPDPTVTPTPPDTLTVPAGDGGPADRGAAFVMLLIGTLAAVWLLARPVRRPSRRRA